MTTPKYTVFITGANRGLGLEFVRQYASENWHVLASCRSLVHAKELQQLSQYFDNISLYQLDVNNVLQLHQISEKFSETHIDLLINNAGIYDGEDGLGELSVDMMKETFLTNAIAPLKISEALLGSVAKSHLKTIVALSSKMGSINDNNSGGSYSFRVSKAALNMIMKNLAVDLKEKSIKVFTIHPGWVKTELNGGSATQISTEQSVSNIRSLLTRLTEQESGNFYDYLGNSVDW